MCSALQPIAALKIYAFNSIECTLHAFLDFSFICILFFGNVNIKQIIWKCKLNANVSTFHGNVRDNMALSNENIKYGSKKKQTEQRQLPIYVCADPYGFNFVRRILFFTFII